MNLFIQFAHHNHDQFDERGFVNSEIALEAFDNFDWEGECKKAEEHQRVSPTISLESPDKSKLIWVSAYFGDEKGIRFVSECSYPGVVPKWFGLSKKMGKISHNTERFTQEQARDVLRLFMLEDYSAIKSTYKNT